MRATLPSSVLFTENQSAPLSKQRGARVRDGAPRKGENSEHRPRFSLMRPGRLDPLVAVNLSIHEGTAGSAPRRLRNAPSRSHIGRALSPPAPAA